jgi:hypothetical protein
MLSLLYPRGKNPGTHWGGSWVDLRAGLDKMAKMKILTTINITF